MSEMRLEPPASAPSPPPPAPPSEPPAGGSLAAGVALAWATMIASEVLLVMVSAISFGNILGAILLPPVAIGVWGIVLLKGNKPRTGKGLLLGLLSIVAVALLLVAACFGLFINNYH